MARWGSENIGGDGFQIVESKRALRTGPEKREEIGEEGAEEEEAFPGWMA